jgi:hypothetical protein
MSDKIVIFCPARKVPVRTGFRAPPGTPLTGLKQVKLENCPACGALHLWNGEDAYWEQDEPEPTFRDVVRSIWRRSKPV